jgi:hypothetical protein
MTEGMRCNVLMDPEMPNTDADGKPLGPTELGADRLVAALTALGYDAVLQETPLREATEDGWILYFGSDPPESLNHCGPRRSALEQRLILMDLDRVTAVDLMNELGLPMVVLYRAFHSWLEDPRAPLEVAGPPALARALGIQLDPEDARESVLRFTVRGMPLPEGIAHCCAMRGFSRRFRWPW